MYLGEAGGTLKVTVAIQYSGIKVVLLREVVFFSRTQPVLGFRFSNGKWAAEPFFFPCDGIVIKLNLCPTLNKHGSGGWKPLPPDWEGFSTQLW